MRRARRCDVCSKLYETASPRSRTCSSTCRSRLHRGAGVVEGPPPPRRAEARRPLAQELLELTLADEPVPVTPEIVDLFLRVLDLWEQDQWPDVVETLAELSQLVMVDG